MIKMKTEIYTVVECAKHGGSAVCVHCVVCTLAHDRGRMSAGNKQRVAIWLSESMCLMTTLYALVGRLSGWME